MDPRHLFIDQRLVGMCIHCGGAPETRDHIPAKALLDEPYPPDLPVLASCGPCNAGASLDEQYLACFIEVTLRGTVDPEGISRPKIRRILAEQPALKERIASSMSVALDGTKIWHPETERVRNVIVKLARGHAAYELYPKFEAPDHVSFRPVQSLTPAEADAFEQADRGEFMPLPEIGSRAFSRACGASPDSFAQSGDWIIVQPERYRYAVEETGGINVRIVLSEYLACEVTWE